ncbi:MAG TPA: hydroxymethylglutaryl-CoA lyase, partial [Ktedonobacterales bacterium]|nr:hydroxymethylglutaryl-CoA lyase [Ktedonobacterales bacterium]
SSMSAGVLGTLPPRVTVVEVGPRDGLQNEHGIVPTAAKIAYIDLLSATGLPVIEATSFVSPRAIPQLADAAAVMAGIQRRPGVRYTALVPNLKGMEAALAHDLREVAVFTGASESFVQRNINCSIAESIARFTPVVARARAAGVRVRGYISTVFGCPYEGTVAPASVVRVAQQLVALGVDELSLGDTIGVATPNQVVEIVGLVAASVPLDRLALHFHDTRGTALANVLAGLEAGVTIFDSSAGGLGGCPYAPGASGNLSTEDLLYMLHGMGIHTGADLDAVVAASRYLAGALGRIPTSRYYQAAEATRG